MKKHIVIIFALIWLSGCSHMKIDREMRRISADTQHRVQEKVTYKSPDCAARNTVVDINSTQLSLDDAVAYAVKHNRALQAKFEEIGIAKADLMQAGLFTNPELAAAVRYPDRGVHAKNKNVEVAALIRISDFWQVPFKTDVAGQVLEQVLLSVQAMILDTILDAKMAYIACLHADTHLQVVDDIYERSVDLKNTIYNRYEHGYANDLDRYLSDASVDRMYIDRKAQQATVAQAYAHLKKVLGLSVDGQRLTLASTFAPHIAVLPDLADLQAQAVAMRPEMEMADRAAKQYQALVQFEKSRIFDDVSFGLTYEQELDGIRKRGPELSLQMPIFDPNTAQIARANFLYDQAKKAQFDVRSTIQQDVYQPHVRLQSLYQEYNRMTDRLLPSVEKGIDFARHYTKQKRATMPELLNTVIFLYENKQRMIDMQQMIWQQQAQLERAVGATIWHA